MKKYLSCPSDLLVALCFIFPAVLHAGILNGRVEAPISASADAATESKSAPFGVVMEYERGLTPASGSRRKFRVLLDTSTPQSQRNSQEYLDVVQKIQTQMHLGMVLPGFLVQTVVIPGAKENDRDSTYRDVPHPAQNRIVPCLTNALEQWFLRPDGYSDRFENALYVRPDRLDLMSLVYLDFSDEDPTDDFHLQTTVSRKPDSRGFFTMSPIPQVTGIDTYFRTGFTLDRCKADHDAEINKRVQQHMQARVQKVTAEFAHLLGA